MGNRVQRYRSFGVIVKSPGYITGRMKAGAPDIEYYGADGHVEVWVAVREK